MLLAGDVGGTKTDLAVFAPGSDLRVPVVQAEFRSTAYPNLETIVRQFLDQIDLPVDWACFAVAGPVLARQAEITNLPWVIAAGELEKRLGLKPVHLLNDLEAISWSIPLLGENDLRTLQAGSPNPHGAIGVVAPGTGLGEGFLTWDGERLQAHPSEGGHSDFAPASASQLGLLQYMWQSHKHVSFEMVCSGKGIPNIYRYLRDNGFEAEPPEIAAELRMMPDPTPIIVDAAFRPNQPCRLCRKSIDLFAEILAGEAGNMAVKVFATGGIFLAGGLPIRTLPALETEEFLSAFHNKGRFTDLLEQIPLQVVIRRTSLTGAARYAFHQGRP
jgi:glucokinase